ncbi:ubiquinone biosynthesis protein UbiE [Actinocatenispora thailandica]|uniref:Ubiquinone biosynthesis protein UbiE n=1 Tax=Actinocatenispora thailandica TaxID=227318 RepID=A0A7R7DWR3_9ACTN|nr:methyltransferase domain-containing protein [Actinocatenispora thailandica]BCJ39312.1 ubiquinone biosynthesis protein UbiE [Actinocatenispora thailandica]
MTDTLTPEERATRYYTAVDEGGEGAGSFFDKLMPGGDWSHGIREAEQLGMSPADSAREMKRRLLGKAGIKAGDTVLEFGSGVGGGTMNMAEMTGARFVGVSSADSLTREARLRAQQRGMTDRVSFVTVDPYEYRTLESWPAESFDAVCFFESVCHVPDKDRFMAAAYSRIRPGGTLFGLDWIQRPFGEYQTDEQIAAIIDPVCEHIRLAGLGTLDGYANWMRAAGFVVAEAVDEFAGIECWGSTPPEDREKWLSYQGKESGDLVRDGKNALDAARGAGVFSVGWWVATKPR